MKLPRFTRPALACASGCLAAVLLSHSAQAAPADPLAGAASPFPTYNKIVLVMEENQKFSTIIGGNTAAPYTNYLARTGALITQSYGSEHPSEPNYLDLFSGSDQNIYDDSVPATNPFSGENLGAALLHSGLTFVGYSEDLPYAGDNTDVFAAAPGDPAGTEDYARKHNPWANWQNDAAPASVDNLGSNYLPSDINQTLTPFTNIRSAGQFQNLPTVSIIVPNQQHDDHGVSGGASGRQLIAAGDKWLQDNLSAYAKWANTHNSLLIVTWDEDDYSSINRVATIFYGAHIKPGHYAEPLMKSYSSSVDASGQPSGVPNYQPIHGITHWNVLRTIEDIYHLKYVGQSNKATPITDIFETK